MISTATLERLLAMHREQRPLVTILTARTQDPGRVVRDDLGRVVGVVEEQLASPEQRELPERNSGVCAFNATWLWERLERLQVSELGEYLLTDLFAQAVAAGEVEGRWPIQAMEVDDSMEAMGVNDRLLLALADSSVRRRLLEELMRSGVSVLDPAATYVDVDVQVGQDTVLLPGTHLTGRTSIGMECTIGPYTSIQDSEIGDGCRVSRSVVESSVLEAGSDVGPFSHLRPGTRVGRDVHLGNFVETKNTTLGAGSASGHFSYLGDARIGE
ncbi:MAG: bifunctional UDP-N-acetylglucosamine diphosphorylase/glucosamine-1-phosphate N-acetyltransferase GlmU, partial [Chloroflexota bacterium]|nr:bifunctional UDP-N-acetylglucosamine diphosphorylase/glucosamine-1-phosphate N-acetyltransferase GlmU [Chloroflexota bacterium]